MTFAVCKKTSKEHPFLHELFVLFDETESMAKGTVTIHHASEREVTPIRDVHFQMTLEHENVLTGKLSFEDFECDYVLTAKVTSSSKQPWNGEYTVKQVDKKPEKQRFFENVIYRFLNSALFR